MGSEVFISLQHVSAFSLPMMIIQQKLVTATSYPQYKSVLTEQSKYVSVLATNWKQIGSCSQLHGSENHDKLRKVCSERKISHQCSYGNDSFKTLWYYKPSPINSKVTVALFIMASPVKFNLFSIFDSQGPICSSVLKANSWIKESSSSLLIISKGSRNRELGYTVLNAETLPII